MTKEAYEAYVQPSLYAGRFNATGSAQFLTSNAAMDQIISETGGNSAALAQRLGTNWTADQKLIRVYVSDVFEFNPRLPSADTPGANTQFVAGGQTSGGVPEIVTDAIPWQNLQAVPIN